MEITAALVKELRERTGSGMMECKKALVETAGDIEVAIELMRKSGLAKADKKAGRVAAEGRIVLQLSEDAKRAAMVEVNCETDFVARDANFIEFANSVAQQLLVQDPDSVASLLELPYGGAQANSIDVERQNLIAKIGENVNIRRFTRFDCGDGLIGSYLHGTRIGVLVELDKGEADVAKDVAMHIAASKPLAISAQDVAPELIEKEKEIFTVQAAESGKPAEIVAKMVEGRLKKYLAEITLLGQAFVKDPDITVEELLKQSGATVRRFERFEVGQGIEKKADNFAQEVMAQVRGH